MLGNNKPALRDHFAIGCVLSTSALLIIIMLTPIFFTIDNSWKRDVLLTSYLDSKLDQVGLDMFKVTLSYLTVYDLLDYVSFYPDAISNLAEEQLNKHRIIVKRVMKSLPSALQFKLNTIEF